MSTQPYDITLRTCLQRIPIEICSLQAMHCLGASISPVHSLHPALAFQAVMTLIVPGSAKPPCHPQHHLSTPICTLSARCYMCYWISHTPGRASYHH